MEANKNKNLGNAGEFYVIAQLAQNRLSQKLLINNSPKRVIILKV